MTTSTSASAQAAASDCDLAAADEGGRVRLRPLLQHAQHDRGAGGVGQPGQLLERLLGVGDGARNRARVR